MNPACAHPNHVEVGIHLLIGIRQWAVNTILMWTSEEIFLVSHQSSTCAADLMNRPASFLGRVMYKVVHLLHCVDVKVLLCVIVDVSEQSS